MFDMISLKLMCYQTTGVRPKFFKPEHPIHVVSLQLPASSCLSGALHVCRQHIVATTYQQNKNHKYISAFGNVVHVYRHATVSAQP